MSRAVFALSWLLIGPCCCSMLWICNSAGGAQGSGSLDPETREELRRSIEQKNPDLDAEAKRELLRRIEKTPKVSCTIEAVTVYTDGIVCRATLASDLPFDCRLSFIGRSLSPICMARLTDGDKNQWGVAPLKNHYTWVPLTEAWTVLIKRGKSVRFTSADDPESPRLVRLKPPADSKTERPAELRYAIAGYSTAYTADLSKYVSVYLIGRGKTPVEWTDRPIPPGTKTGVVDLVDAPKKARSRE